MYFQERTLLLKSFVLLMFYNLCLSVPQSDYYNNYNYPYYNRRSRAHPYRSAAAITSQYRQKPQVIDRLPPTNSAANSIRSSLNDGGSNSNNNNDIFSALFGVERNRATAAATRARATRKPLAASEPGKYRVSRADAENAKFAGANNQEAEEQNDDSGKSFISHKLRRRPNRCSIFGRDAAGAASADQRNSNAPPKEQGRFLFDLNVYNVYPNSGYYPAPAYDSYGCGGGLFGGYGGFGGGLGSFGGLGGLGGGGGGLLSDPVPATPPLNNLLSLFAPGILQNALAITARPPPLRPLRRPLEQADNNVNTELNDLENDANVDPNYIPPASQAPQAHRPNRIYYDSAGASPITPAQLVGGVATTVNGIIQQLTGNVQPVYQSYYRSHSLG